MPKKQFSIRTLLILFAAVAIVAGVAAYCIERVEVEVDLAHGRDPTSRVENILVVDDMKQFSGADKATIRLPRWKAWVQSNHPFHVIERTKTPARQ
jgi:hypothetical protein